MSDQFYDIPELHGDLYLGHNWLTQMGEAAARYGLRIQYCMALPRYVLHSLHTAAVTQVGFDTLGRNNTAAILQTTFSNPFHYMKTVVF